MKKLHIHRAPHNLTQLYVHLVFVTKCRRKLLEPERIEDYRALFSRICARIGSKLVSDPQRAARLCELVEFGMEPDHVHLLVRYPPTLSISDLVQYLKGLSSHEWPEHDDRLNETRQKRFSGEPLWASSYFAKSVGHKSIQETVDYQKSQGQKATRKSAGTSLTQRNGGPVHNDTPSTAHAAAR